MRMGASISGIVGGLAALAVISLMTLDVGSGPLTATVAKAEEKPADIIAAQIRGQGFPCESPLSAERDRKLSKPDEAVWELKCKNATYRVRLIPHMAAHVERLD